MHSKEILLINYLMEQDDFVTAEQAAKEIGVSRRTVMNMIQNCEEECEDHGMKIVGKRNAGLKLEVFDTEKASEFRRSIRYHAGHLKAILTVHSQDFIYLALRLASACKEVSLDDLMDEMKIARSKFYELFKDVNDYYETFQIRAKVNKGICNVYGSETGKRRVMTILLMEIPVSSGNNDYSMLNMIEREKFNDIFNEIISLLERRNLTTYSTFPIFFTNYLLAADYRFKQGNHLEKSEALFKMKQSLTYDVSKELIGILQEKYCMFVNCDDTEVLRCAELLFFNWDLHSSDNILEKWQKDESAEAETIAKQCVRYLNESYGLEFHMNERFINGLQSCIVDIITSNKMDFDYAFKINVFSSTVGIIRSPLCWFFSYEICRQISVRGSYEISTKAVCLIANLVLSAAVEHKLPAIRKSVLISVSSGQSVSSIIERSLQKSFRDTVGKIKTVQPYELRFEDFGQWDYIISDVQSLLDEKDKEKYLSYGLDESSLRIRTEAFAVKYDFRKYLLDESEIRNCGKIRIKNLVDFYEVLAERFENPNIKTAGKEFLAWDFSGMAYCNPVVILPYRTTGEEYLEYYSLEEPVMSEENVISGIWNVSLRFETFEKMGVWERILRILAHTEDAESMLDDMNDKLEELLYREYAAGI